jgi:hypothetical protein
MNAIEEIAKTQPKENAGPRTSKRFEYQMNWGLKKLLDLEASGSDYTIAFDYHDDIIVFNKEEDATEVNYYQVKTKANGHWRLKEIYDPNPIEDESEKEDEADECKGVVEEKDKKEKKKTTAKSKKMSYMAKLLSHSLLIKASKNFFFVTNRQFSKAGFKKAPTGKQLSFIDIQEDTQKAIKDALQIEIPELDVSKTENFYILQDQIPLDGFQQSLKGYVGDFLKLKAAKAEIDSDVFYDTLLHQIIRSRNNYDEDIYDPKQFLAKKCFTKSQFAELVNGLANLESFNSRCHTISSWLSTVPPFESDKIRMQLSEIRKDMTIYGNLGLSRMLNKIRDVIDSNELEASDATYLDYAKRLVDILRREMGEANSYDGNYLIALILYEKSKL